MWKVLIKYNKLGLSLSVSVTLSLKSYDQLRSSGWKDGSVITSKSLNADLFIISPSGMIMKYLWWRPSKKFINTKIINPVPRQQRQLENFEGFLMHALEHPGKVLKIKIHNKIISHNPSLNSDSSSEWLTLFNFVWAFVCSHTDICICISSNRVD